MKHLIYASAICLGLAACGGNSKEDSGRHEARKADSLAKDSVTTTTLEPAALPAVNDTLNSIAAIIAGQGQEATVYKQVTESKDYTAFSGSFDKRWHSFDSSRLASLKKFRDEEITKIVDAKGTLFYPFSGPDILYAYTFFPKAQNYVMLGLEPVGGLPDFEANESDSLKGYFNKINTSLNAILKFSFFRTESMGKDLRNREVNGTLHLLFLFLKRTGNSIVSAKPLTVDSTGQMVFLGSFDALRQLKVPVKGVEIQFITSDKELKHLYYYSLNAADGGLKSNKGFVTYLQGMGKVDSYLKGASYLMHKSYFSGVRNVILNQSQHVVQDDSGIAFHYFGESGRKWSYTLFGKYTRPIPMFSEFYQKDLDSSYKAQGSKDIGFGIGYNFKDKNSNFMIATAVD